LIAFIPTCTASFITLAKAGFDQKKLESESKAIGTLLAKTMTNSKSMAADSKFQADEQKLLKEILATLAAYSKDSADMLDMLESDANAATMYMGQADDKYAVMEKQFAELSKIQKRQNDANYTDSIHASRKVLITLASGIISRSKLPAPGSRDVDLLLLRTKCAPWPNALPAPPVRSAK